MTNLNSYLKDLITDEKNSRTALTNKWLELWNLYKTKPLRVQGDDGWQSKLNDGRIFEIVETVGSYFRNAIFFSDAWVDLESNEPGLAEILPLVSAYFRDALNHSNLKRELRVATAQYLLTGNTAMRVFWDDDDEGLKFEAINIYDIFIESCRRYDPQYSYVFRTLCLNRAEFQEWADKGMFNEMSEDADEIFDKFKETTKTDAANFTSPLVNAEFVEVVEFYDPLEKTLYRCVEDHVMHEETGVDESPWLFAPLFETPEEAYGLSIVDSSLGLVLENNILMNRRLDNIAVSVDNMWLFVDDGVTNPNNIKARPGAVLTVARPDTLTPLRPPANNFSVTYQEASVLDAKIDRNIGTGAMISANTFRTGERVTAEEIQSVKEAGGNRLTDVYEIYENMLIIPLLQRAYKLLRENMKSPATVKFKSNKPKVYEYYQVLPEDLRKDFSVKVAASQHVINRDRNIKRLTDFVTLVGSVPQFAKLVSWDTLFYDLLLNFGFDDPTKFILPKQEPAAPTPTSPLEAMKQGMAEVGGQPFVQALQEKVAGGQLPNTVRTLLGQPPSKEEDPAEDSAVTAAMMMPLGTN